MKRLLLVVLLFGSQVSYTSQDSESSKIKMSMRDRGICAACGAGCIATGIYMVGIVVNEYPKIDNTRELSDATLVAILGAGVIAQGLAIAHIAYTGDGNLQKKVATKPLSKA